VALGFAISERIAVAAVWMLCYVRCVITAFLLVLILHEM